MPQERHQGAVPPSFASSAAIRAFSASFSSRARRAMSLTTSNSSRLTTSRSRRIFSAWLRTIVSTSRLTPWAAPAASFIKRPISSKNRLLVWVIPHSPADLHSPSKDNGDPLRSIQDQFAFDFLTQKYLPNQGADVR